ncbi:MAG: hypothetical protein A4E35_00855 [Methanoregula sp. PtaU1.Bin051]|nr:MAG: hypothetical protein A4E35_00855 [Methanoregula sp. PtaU1.Bin051]
MQQNATKHGKSRRIQVKKTGINLPAGAGSGRGSGKERGRHKTSIQVSGMTKLDLDRVKTEARTETYEEAIRFLLEERKKHRPKTFGLLAGTPSFVRDEEGDSYRIRH